MKSGRNVFLTGEPGSGKTFTINTFIKWCNENGVKPDVTATTGTAALHVDGQTIHSWSGLGIHKTLTDEQIAKIANEPWNHGKLISCEVLIIDEISMFDAHRLDTLDRILSYAKGNMDGFPFGGVQVILVGDFFQLPPIDSDDEEDDAPFAFLAKVWERLDLAVCYLTEQHRQSDPVFVEILTAIRSGTLKEAHHKHLKAADRVPPDDRHIMKLHSKKWAVEQENITEFAKLPGEKKVFFMELAGDQWKSKRMSERCPSPVKLSLKIGALVMFTKNKYEKDDDGNSDFIYANGTIGEVVDWSANGLPLVKLRDGRIIEACYEKWEMKERSKVVASIEQVPLRLSWSNTIHKSQGMSADEMIIDLRESFACGQGYVAVSRVRTLDGLYLRGYHKDSFKMDHTVVEWDKKFRELSANNE